MNLKKTLLMVMTLLANPALADKAPTFSTDAVDAGTPKPTVTFMSAEQLAPHQKIIDHIQSYLSNMTTIVSDFTQVAPDGTLTSGKFYLMRPGKMRWQYNPPTPILMVSSGTELVYYDIELEQVSHIPLDDTLIGFLAQDKITFDKKVGIVDFSVEAGAIRITLAQRDKPNDGKLELEFSDKPLLIRNMVITDATHQVTSVSLNNARFGLPIDPELFVFRDPRKGGKIH
jgi:outer membrane lipoprotein-sorting protein